MLTFEQLEAMPPHTIFAQGEIENSPEGIFMTDSFPGRKLLWVAKRGYIHDWAIYCGWLDVHVTVESILKHGDKVTGKANIQKLVPCNHQAFEMYRR